MGSCAPAAPAAKPAAVTIGLLTPSPASFYPGLWAALREKGWTYGDNLIVEYRQGSVTSFPSLATELVQLKVALLITQSEAASRAAKAATRTIPIVLVAASDAVGAGLVASLAHPGGNITGISWLGPEISAKQVELLHESVPGLTRLAVLWHPGIPDLLTDYQGVQKAAQTLGIDLVSAQAGSPVEVKPALGAVVSQKPDGLLVLGAAAYAVSPANRDILEFTTQHQLPAIYPSRTWVANGGLMAYAAQAGSLYAHVAVYVDKLLKGAQPGDLPVEQPTDFDFVVNAGAAARLGLTIPASVAAQVTEWIK